MSDLPILYSFRRCPYAMRARLAIKHSGLKVELREIILRNKPQPMLDISPKGTVPVLQLTNGNVIDESWDIVHWATTQQEQGSIRGSLERIEQANELINQNDNDFKQHLDHYKYADRFPEHSVEYYRTEAEVFLQSLENRLSQQSYLLDNSISLADIGVFPFIRQFAHVDIDWFRQAPYLYLISWMDKFMSSQLFNSIMQKYPPWVSNDSITVL